MDVVERRGGEGAGEERHEVVATRTEAGGADVAVAGERELAGVADGEEVGRVVE